MTTEQEMQEQAKKLQEKLDKLHQQINSMPDEVETKRWRDSDGNAYYYICDDTNICRDFDARYEEDDTRYSIGNYFKTRQEAEEYKENLLTKQKLKDLALRLNNGVKIDWSTVLVKKYHIMYNYSQNKLQQPYDDTWIDMGQVYCLDSNFLEIAKKEIGEDKLIKLFKSGV